MILFVNPMRKLMHPQFHLTRSSFCDYFLFQRSLFVPNTRTKKIDQTMRRINSRGLGSIRSIILNICASLMYTAFFAFFSVLSFHLHGNAKVSPVRKCGHFSDSKTCHPIYLASVVSEVVEANAFDHFRASFELQSPVWIPIMLFRWWFNARCALLIKCTRWPQINKLCIGQHF